MSELFNPVPGVRFGFGSRSQLTDEVARLGGRRIFVLCDQVLLNNPHVKELLAVLAEQSEAVFIWDSIRPDPDTQLLAEMVAAAADHLCDCFVAIGGGSTLDLAKAGRVVLATGKTAQELEGYPLQQSGLPPLIVLPTTAGTGSEVTCFAVIKDIEAQKKRVLAGPALSADLALVDPQLTLSVPVPVTAATGMDALTHAIEAFLSVLATPLTDLHAGEAVRLLCRWLPQACIQPDSEEARERVMLGSLHAGIAFNSAVLGLAHAIAHPLGAMFGIPHGQANAMVLAQAVAFNSRTVPARVQALGEFIGLREGSGCEDVVLFLQDLKRMLNIPGLADYGITHRDIPALVHATMEEAALLTNPAPVAGDDVRQILETLLG